MLTLFCTIYIYIYALFIIRLMYIILTQSSLESQDSEDSSLYDINTILIAVSAENLDAAIIKIYKKRRYNSILLAQIIM